MSEYLLIHPVRKNPDSDFRYLCVACWWDSNSRFISCRWFSNNVLSSSIRALRWLASSDISSGESTTVMVVFSARVIALHIPLTILSERLCKARAEAKFTWIMPSRRQRCIYMKRLHTFPYTQFFPRKTRHTRH